MADRYLTYAELLDILGKDRLERLAPAKPGARPAIMRAKSQAEGLATSWLNGRYGDQLPTTPTETPQVLKEQIAEVTIYKLASATGDVVAPELKERFDAAVAWLRSVGSGSADLGLESRPAVDQSTPQILANKSRRDLVFGNGGLEDW